MTKVMAVLLFLLAPLLLALPLLTGQSGGWGNFVIAAVACILLVGAGVLVFRASAEDWMTLTLDASGIILKRGRNVQRRDWSDISFIQATRRKNGRVTVPTVLITCTTGELYLDDVYTLRPSELVKRMQERCAVSGNPWPNMPTPPPRKKKARRIRMGWFILPGLAIVLALMAMVRVMHQWQPRSAIPPSSTITQPK